MAAFPTSQPLFNPQMHQGRASVDLPVTLLLKHLPEAIPSETLSRLLSHYGASAVHPCVGGRLRNCAFVDFKNEAVAVQAQRQLHGLQFLGKVLLVEKAVNSAEDSKSQRSEAQSRNPVTSSSSLMKDATSTMDFFGGSKSHGIPASEPIASRLGVDYPFPPNLEYAYPPPDGNILTNIVNALIAVPHFYTQVLHLMNKMNIPAPFRMALPTPPLPPSGPAPPPPPPPILEKPKLPESSSGESEMESSDEEVDDEASGHRHKKAKHEAIVGPATDKDIAHENVGLRSANLVPKEMPIIKKKNPFLQINIAPKTIISQDSNNGTMKELGDTVRGLVDNKTYLSAEELQSGKLPPEEILSLPMFKNYVAGDPASVLYIKNLSKDVVSDDFYFIFGSLFGSLDLAKSGLSVKLMREGRMRGQAFVTFPSIELAHQALKLVNGYVFRGKPMIIQFGRNPASGKSSSNV